MGFLFRSYHDVWNDVRDWCRRLPQIGAVAGIPRSGCLIASMIAQERQIPLRTADEVIDGRKPRRMEWARELASTGPIMVVDDTAWSGRTIQEYRKLVNRPGVLYGALYVSGKAKGLDHAGFRLPTPHHTFAWNLLRDVVSARLAVDLDGVLCPDPPRKEPIPCWLPGATVQAIITGRPEAHREVTERWLERHGITYGTLDMLPDRYKGMMDQVQRFKGSAVRRLHRAGRIVGFVESCPVQAEWIATATRLPVVCWQNHRHWNCATPIP